MMNALAIVTLLAAGLIGCENGERAVQSRPHVYTSSADTSGLAVLSWLQGYWTGLQNGTSGEELWLPPRGNIMVGLHVDLLPSGQSFFEYLRIEQRGDTLIYAASPLGRTPTFFKATKIGSRTATFENPQHDFPQAISYFVDEAGMLHATASGVIDGRNQMSEWTWSRRDLPDSPRGDVE